MVLGYRGHQRWRDMSDYLVHFTGGTDNATPLDNLASILADGGILASRPFGSARTLYKLGDSQKSACFSEVPLDLLERLVRRRSSFGVGFHQSKLIERGGTRVWYVEDGSDLAEVLAEWVTDSVGDWKSPLWNFTPFIDRPFGAPFAGYRFEWEREWRVLGGFEFEPHEIAFLFAPRRHHKYLRDLWEHDLGLSAEDLPLVIDPRWAQRRLLREFSMLPQP